MRVGRWGRASILLGAGTPRQWNDLEGTTFLLLLTTYSSGKSKSARRKPNLNILYEIGHRITKLDSQLGSRLVVPKISHFQSGLLDIVGRSNLASWQVAWHCKIPFELSSDPH